MNPIYRFFLTIQQERREVFPLYGNDIYKVYNLENDQQYYRTTLDGKFKFIKGDYDFIMSAPFDAVVYVDITKSNDNGRSFSTYFNGKFMRTDCTINADNKILQTKFTAIDQYENILAGLEKEYDLIKLKPKIEQLFINSRPAVQLYIAGDDVLTSFVGGTYFEQEVSSTDDEAFLTNTCHFNKLCLVRDVVIDHFEGNNPAYNPSPGTNEEVLGRYYCKAMNNVIEVDNVTQTLREPLVYQKIDSPNIFLEFKPNIGLKIYKKVSGQDVIILDKPNIYRGSINPGQQVAITDDTGTYRLYYINTAVYGRILHNGLKEGEYFDKDVNDLIEETTYSHVNSLPVLYANYIYLGSTFSKEPTEYGIRQPGEYFVKPPGIASLYPVGRSQWVNTSIWFTVEHFYADYDKYYSSSFMLKHAYPLYSCIKVLLAEIAPELKFEDNILYSKFLFADKNPVSADSFRLYITPKSNILKGEYDQPAQKAPITLKNIFDMLRDCFRCYWFVENSKLRLEHISYFRNGMNYTSELEPGLNLLKVYEPKLNRPWTFATNEYKFEKAKMPERYQFEWMDDQTEPFDGLAIDVLSNYVDKGNTENISVSKFSSDIDLALINPSSFSSDGFMLIAADTFTALAPYGGAFQESQAVIVESSGDFGSNFWELDPKLFKYASQVTLDIKGQLRSSDSRSFRVVCVRFVQGQPIYDAYTVASHDITMTTGSFSIELTIDKEVSHIGIFDLGSPVPYTVYFTSIKTVGLYKPAMVDRKIAGNKYSMQNGLLAFADLQPKYYMKDMPATHVKVNGEEVFLSVKNTKRNRLQEIKFPSGKNDINPMQLVKTELGNGQVDKVKINLTSRIAEATLRHYNE